MPLELFEEVFGVAVVGKEPQALCGQLEAVLKVPELVRHEGPVEKALKGVGGEAQLSNDYAFV